MSFPKLNNEQKNAFRTIAWFLKHPAVDTLILKGYAGTGKTYLMQALAKWLREKERDFCLLASTGRAASVLKGKTGFDAKTVHGELYHFSRVEGDDDTISIEAPVDKYGQMTLQFRLRASDMAKRVYIIDESSMLSSEISDTSIAAFGSGELMTDLFEATRPNKIIFVGDPCQLPPVGELSSPALDGDWLFHRKRNAITVSLTTIERTKGDNDVLQLATQVRKFLDELPTIKYTKLPAAGKENINLYESADQLFDAYVFEYNKTGTNGCLAIARSNRMVQNMNRQFRIRLYGKDNEPLRVNDVLLVYRNNYKVPLTNGDFVVVTSIGEARMKANLRFQSIRIRALASDTDYELLLSLDALHGEGQFTKEQQRDLMIDFSRRVKNKGIAANTPEYKAAMMKDDYINCLQAAYGYAVTCHKAQGGEWDNVFLFLDSKMYGMPQIELFRWWYTAITRAKKQLHLENGWWIC